jgi:lipoprotein-anchoring transpeptidase ErfK/SrfK
MKQWIIALELTALLQLPAAATELKPDVINAATFTGKLPSEDRINPLAVKVQVLLDRARFSPGEIDGRFGDRVGDKINVVSLSADKQSSKVSRIEVDKGRETVRTLAQDGTLVAFYPASVGSEEKPTPSGTLKVVSIQPNPTYQYDPGCVKTQKSKRDEE